MHELILKAPILIHWHFLDVIMYYYCVSIFEICGLVLSFLGHKKHIDYFKNIKADSRNTTFYTTFLQIQQLELHFPQKKFEQPALGTKIFRAGEIA